jgi:phospholipase/carboxylesterase
MLAATLSVTANCMPASDPNPNIGRADASRGEIAVRPSRALAREGSAGLHDLELAAGTEAMLYVPAGYRSDRPFPVVVMLHGAGGAPRHSLELVRRHADRLGFVVLALRSRAATWDIIGSRRYGPDVSALDFIAWAGFCEAATRLAS